MSGSDFSGEDGTLKIDESKGKESGKEKEPKWRPKPGNLVWAKVAGYNHWPGKVFSSSDGVIPDWLREQGQGNKKTERVLVRFFGTYDIEWVTLKAIESYENGLKKKLNSKSRRKAFLKAVKEIKEFVDSGVEPEGMTAKPSDPDEEVKSDSEKEEEMEETEEEPRARRSKRLRSSRSTPGRTPKKQKLQEEKTTPKKATTATTNKMEPPDTPAEGEGGRDEGVKRSPSKVKDGGNSPGNAHPKDVDKDVGSGKKTEGKEGEKEGVKEEEGVKEGKSESLAGEKGTAVNSGQEV